MRVRRAVVVAAALTTLRLVTGPVDAGAPPPGAPASAPVAPEPAVGSVVPAERRAEVLPAGWQASRDMAWTTVGDAGAFHLLTAYEREGYAWRTAASLSEPGYEADRWIGNVCITASGRRAVVVYAPRAFANKAPLFQRGGFTAVVDLETGQVRKLGLRSTLAYYNPGCGYGEGAVVSQARGGERPDEGVGATRIFSVDTTTAMLGRPVELPGQVTSPIPVRGGVAAAAGRRLVAIDGRVVRTVATLSSVPFRLVAEGDDGVAFMDHAAGVGYVRHVATTAGTPVVRELARGELTSVNLLPGTGGRAWVTGAARITGALPGSMGHVPVPRSAEVSTDAHLAVLHDEVNSSPVGAEAAAVRVGEQPVAAEPSRAVTLKTLVVPTGRRFDFMTTPGARTVGDPAEGFAAHPLNGLSAPAAAAPVPSVPFTSPTNPVDPDATCAVARNDPRTQVYQPTPRQVEWAADQAVVGNLTMTRPSNWKQSGLPAWTPQGMFPPIPLVGGGRVNVQVLLGILAQESNLWQASGHAVSGVTGNPLVGNFYGRDVYDADGTDDWDIYFSEADCGYGVSQITDGMRKAGSERPGEVALPANHQRALAVDYATNIAGGLRILQDKWNQTRGGGLIHSNGDPKWVENWFFAVWAYNSGYYPDQGNGEPWGVGWFNNPANPIYPANRTFFHRNPADAAHPQDWPYPEKVVGWAAYPIATLDGAGFRGAWWVSVESRDRAKPPIYTFCTAANTCEPGKSYTPNAPEAAGAPAGPCAHKNSSGQYDLKCWWHSPVEFNWCGSGYCGNELWRFDTTYPEQPDGTRYPPNCTLAGLPSGARIVDDVADTVPSVRPNCGHPWTNAGTFSLTFASDTLGRYPSKVDFHQIGGGFGGHFWFAHTRKSGDWGGKMKVTGKWTFNTPMTTWGRVLVHMPDHGAHTQQARYVVDLGDGTTKTRYALQRTLAHRWVSLGVMKFNGTPSVTLATETYDGRGEEDVAWDAVAIQPLAAKPSNFVVALGDSYASGEGASDPTGGDDYYRETDNNGDLDDDKGRNACHRSPSAWSRLATLAGNASSIGARADSWDPSLDFQLHACSGARTHNVLPFYTSPLVQPQNAFGLKGTGQYGELSQIDKGYLDQNTTLVTIAIGGNDARFSDVIKECVYAAGLYECPDATLSGENEPLKVTVPRSIDGPVRSSILTTLKEIRKRAPNARIVLMGYPRLLENNGQCVPGIGTAEAPWINEMGDRMTAMMDAVATQATVEGVPTWFSNPTDEFAGKGICGDPETIHGIVGDTTDGDKPQFLNLPPSNQSFHPKITGTPLYAASLNETLRRMGL